MPRIIPIVEGQGDVQAVPVLIRRIGERVRPGGYIDVLPAIRVRRNNVVKAGVLERYVELAAHKSAPDGGILVLLDADRDCPMSLGTDLLTRAREARSDRTIKLVLAKVEFESWFLASAKSIAGQKGICPECGPPPDPEAIRDPKGWLTRQMPPSPSLPSSQ